MMNGDSKMKCKLKWKHDVGAIDFTWEHNLMFFTKKFCYTITKEGKDYHTQRHDNRFEWPQNDHRIFNTFIEADKYVFEQIENEILSLYVLYSKMIGRI